MYLLNKFIDDLTEADIQRLVDNAIPESKILDYKAEIKLGNDEEKKEFLADITAFANTEGGVIIFGIEENKDSSGKNTGLPGNIVGIAESNQDQLIQRIEDTVRSNTDPKINKVGIKLVNVNGKKVLVIGVTKFIGLPHMMTFKSSNKFYKRRNTGKYLLDTNELNELFMNNYLLKERASNFVRERIIDVRNGLCYPNLDVEGSFFLHIIPIGHLGENIIDLTNFDEIDFYKLRLRPLTVGGWDSHFNFDGFATFTTNNLGVIHSYTQLFRDGSVEFYTTHFQLKNNDTSQIQGAHIEEYVYASIKKIFEVYEKLQIEPPFAIFINLFDTSNSSLIGYLRMFDYQSPHINRTNVVLPSVIINSTDLDLWKVLKPVFDILWQAGGLPQSPYYNKDGTRKNQIKP